MKSEAKKALLVAFCAFILCGCPKQAKAQVPVTLSSFQRQQFLDVNGKPLAGGKLCTFQAGTSTPLATYTDSTGLFANTNPVTLDSGGFAVLWLTASAYRFILYDSTGNNACPNSGVQQWTLDFVTAPPFSAGNNAWTGNNTFSGTTTFSGPANLNAGGALNGTISGSPSFSGADSFTGSILVSGSATFSGPLIVSSLTSATANPAAAGVVRLANADTINWRNSTNTNDCSLSLLTAAFGNNPVNSLQFLCTGLAPNVMSATGFSSGTNAVSVTGVYKMAPGEKVSWRDPSNTVDIALNAPAAGIDNDLIYAGIPTVLHVTSDFTTANNTNLQAIPGLAWNLPANVAMTVPFSCHLLYSQATAAVADQFGIQDVNSAPTNIMAKAQVYTSTSALTAGNLPTLTSTTATPVVTFTPSGITTVFNADIDGLIEQPNGVLSAFQVMVQTSNGADAVTIKRGSYCRAF